MVGLRAHLWQTNVTRGWQRCGAGRDEPDRPAEHNEHRFNARFERIVGQQREPQRRREIHHLFGAEFQMKNLESMTTSPPDRENVVFEIWCGTQEVAEISKEPGRDYEIELYAATHGGAWHFELNEFKAMLEKGINELANNS